eukprot:CAMPEP_0113712774 /NCGR_PEP_ID=MMETSP0038_2-20120614/31587_1 /TAXON_ID=2898 /ORGANISM="Cryptomonas paramecium" /LENGTH=105 /DNA_ID=CAMNT_0000639355 /DNA_START=9 /DNA_END=326 /DNA_ORIENTATION=+ /assembly_acc=CAM_ASM_000170
MNWQDICNMCCGDRQAFWDKLARQLQRYRYCVNGDCTVDRPHDIPGHQPEPMDTETFLFMGFMIVPLLFVLWGLFQRMGRRRRELPQGKAAMGPPGPHPPMPPVD